MRAAIPRATFIALRARRQAYRIATDILYDRPLDMRAVECPACHSMFQAPPEAYEVAVCGACSQPVALPAHLRTRPLRVLTEEEMEAAAEDERLTAYAEAQAAREVRRILWFWVVTGAAGLIVAFCLIYVLSPRV